MNYSEDHADFLKKLYLETALRRDGKALIARIVIDGKEVK